MAVTFGLARELLKVCIRNVLRGAEVHAYQLEQRFERCNIDELAFCAQYRRQNLIPICSIG